MTATTRAPGARWDPATTFAPSRTTTATVTLATALVAAGLYLGAWAENASPAGREWVARLEVCVERTRAAGLTLPRASALEACTAGVSARLAAASALGVVVVAGLAALGALLVPVVLRRRHALRPADARFAAAVERFGALAADAGVPRARLDVAGPRQTDAFAYGSGRVALPRALALRARDGRLFDPVVRHELVHVRRRDAGWVWVVTAAWWVLAVLLAVPVVWAAVDGDPSILGAYVWRSAVLVAATFVAARALVREREHDADLDSASAEEQRAALRALLARQGDAPSRRARPPWLALHPSAAQRLAVLDRPERASHVTALDAAAVAFFGMLAVALVRGPLLTVPGAGSVAIGVPAAGLGILLGLTLGLATWRDAVLRRAAGTRASVAPAAVGAFAGIVLGGVCSLGNTSGLSHATPAGLGLTAVAVAGAVVLTRGLAELTADAAPHLPRVAAWVLVAGGAAAACATALWAGLTVDASLSLGGRWLGLMTAATLVPVVWPAATFWALAAVAALLTAVRRAGGVPAWARSVDEPHPVRPWPLRTSPALPALLLVGMCGGATGAGVVAVFRALAGPAGADAVEQRYAVYTWVLGATAVAAMLASVVGLGADVAAALVAGLTAAVVAVTGFVLLNTALGGHLTWEFVQPVQRGIVAMGFVLVLATAPALLAARAGRAPAAEEPAADAAAVPATERAARAVHPPVGTGGRGLGEPPRRAPRRLAVAGVVAGSLAGLLGASALAARDSLYPATTAAADAVTAQVAAQNLARAVASGRGPDAGTDPPPPTETDVAATASEADLRYLREVVPTVAASVNALDRAIAAVLASGADGTAMAAQLEAGPVAAARQLRDLAQTDGAGLELPAVVAAHALEVRAAQDLLSAVAAWAVGLRFDDLSVQQRAQDAYTAAFGEWQRWGAMVSEAAGS